MDADIGTIAISDDVVAEKELPPSQRWPWDSSKGIYYMQGYHNLHCLVLHLLHIDCNSSFANVHVENSTYGSSGDVRRGAAEPTF